MARRRCAARRTRRSHPGPTGVLKRCNADASNISATLTILTTDITVWSSLRTTSAFSFGPYCIVSALYHFQVSETASAVNYTRYPHLTVDPAALCAYAGAGWVLWERGWLLRRPHVPRSVLYSLV